MKNKSDLELLAHLQNSTIEGTSKVHGISWEQVLGLRTFLMNLPDRFYQINAHLGEEDTYTFTLYNVS